MAIGKFSICLPYTLREEGGESNDPRDPGGNTNRGVTQARYDQYRAAKRLQPKSVSLISESELQDLYRTGYWDAIGAEQLRPGEDLSAFDYAVNSGPAKARAAIVTANAAAPPLAKVIENIATARLSFLHGLTTWRAFGRGWGARVARIEAASLKMAGLPIAPNAVSAKAQQKANSKSAKSAAPIAAAAGAGAHATGSHLWATIAVVAAIVAVAAVAAYNAWRQGQRATILANAAAAQTADAAQAAAKAAAPATAPAKS
jgi:lysozyme family protein